MYSGGTIAAPPSPSRLTALAAWLRAALASPRIIAWATALAALLSIPVLFHGFRGDDHTLRGFLLHVPPWAEWAKSPIELFTFFDGDPARTRSLIDHGVAPWWTDPSLRIMFFRPLSAFTHWLDFRLWPTSAALMHLQTVGWYLVLVFASGTLYRRVLGAGWIAGFATLAYALDNNHGLLVEWISNRNALIASAFSVAALIFHDRARRERKARFALISAASFALGLLGGEVALGAVGYLVGYALFLDEAPLRARVASLTPHFVVLAAWLIAYRVGGFGAHGSGIYVDPGRSPFTFLQVALKHIPLLLQGELGGLPPDILIFVPRPSPLIYVGAVALLSVVLIALWPLRRDARARFFGTGALLSTIPAAATFPAGRLMILAGLGLLGLVALVVSGVVDRTRTWRPGPARWAAIYMAAWVGGGHLFASPLLFVIASHQMVILEQIVARYGDALLEAPELARQRVIVVNAPDTFFTYYVMGMRITAGRVAPGTMMVIGAGTRGMELSRRDARTLVVRSDEGFYRGATDLLTRSLDTPMPVGTQVALTGVTVEVTKTNEAGVPTEAVFAFVNPLEDESMRWVEWREKTFMPFVFPKEGETRRIEGQMPSL